MKKILSLFCTAIMLSSCATTQLDQSILNQTRDAFILTLLQEIPGATGKVIAGNYAQAFGDALRSLEGTEVGLIPAQIAILRARWLPQGSAYTDFAGQIAQIYLSAHPVSNAEAQKVLEAIALALQTK